MPSNGARRQPQGIGQFGQRPGRRRGEQDAGYSDEHDPAELTHTH